MKHNKLSYFMNGVTLLILFFLLAVFTYLDASWVQAIDKLGDWLLRVLIPDQLFNFFIEITSLADATQIVLFGLVLTLLLFIFKKGIEAVWTLCTITICGVVVPHVLKVLIMRDRPEYGVIYAGGYSFPSGHATMATVFYGLIIIWALICLKKSWKKHFIFFTMSSLILLIMWSRVYLGIHYFSDVIGGLLLGVGQLFISIGFYWSFQNRTRG